MSDLQELHSLVWRFRREMEANGSGWVTPSKHDALRFAFTEAAEAMDAYMRAKGGYARNNEGHDDVLAELADCAIMLMTAANDRSLVLYRDDLINGPTIIDDIAIELGTCLQSLQHTESAQHFLISYALTAISLYPGMDLDTEVKRRLYRIAHKHLPQEKAFDLVMCDLYEIGFAD